MAKNKNTRKKKYSKKNKRGGFGEDDNLTEEPQNEEPQNEEPQNEEPQNEEPLINKPPQNVSQCEANNLVNLKTPDEIHANYQVCCPKKFFMKNSSPYCKQVDLNFQAARKNKSINNEYAGLSDDPMKVHSMMNKPPPPPFKKPWYKLWGGKNRTRKRTKRRRTKKRQTKRKR